jgi:uncharacterized protein
VAVVLDTSVLVALMSAADAEHPAVAAWYAGFDDDLVTTPLAVAEMDHLLRRHGSAGVRFLRRSLESGAIAVRWWADAMLESVGVARRRPELGLTDASLVALAGRLRTTRIATLDHRHFRTLTAPGGEAFTLFPADAT